MTIKDYQQLILQGTQDLPPDSLAEIVDFIFFIRQKLFYPQRFDQALQESLPTSSTIRESPESRQYDTDWLKLAESSFEFWDNEEDAIYDTL